MFRPAHLLFVSGTSILRPVRFDSSQPGVDNLLCSR